MDLAVEAACLPHGSLRPTRAAQESCKLRTGSAWSRSTTARSTPTPRGASPAPTRPGGHSSDDEERTVDYHNGLFAKRVGDYLESARVQHRYDRLVLVAAPKVLGLVRKELGKDLSWFNAREIERYFAKGSGRAP